MKKNYCLLARVKGDELTIEASLCDELRSEYLRAVKAAEGFEGSADRRAFAASIEWERMGDFLASVGQAAKAANAYRESLLSCLDGDYYDHGRVDMPCRFLRVRFVLLVDKVGVFCSGDTRLRELLFEDSAVRKARKMICGDDF